MKQSIKSIVTILSLILGLGIFSFAQDLGSGNAIQSANSIPAGDNYSSENTAKATFSTMFPNASQQKWTTAGSTSFVSFLNKGRKATASFNSKGNLNYLITSCSMNNLPAVISKNLKSNYSNYQLSHAIEIKAHGETAYQAVIEMKMRLSR